MGNAWISPIDSVMTWASFLYQVSLIDEAGFDLIDEQAKYTKEKLDNGQNMHASLEFLRTQNLIEELTDGVDFYNILTKIPKSNRDDRSFDGNFLGTEFFILFNCNNKILDFF